MERKMKIGDFAEAVGGSAKSIYERLKKNSELPDNEKLFTVKEKFKGREITLIVTNDTQINLYKNIYGNSPTITGNYEEFVTLNNGYSQVNESEYIESTTQQGAISPDIFDKLLTLNNEFNDRLERANNELITAKSQLLFLEDKRNTAEGDKKHWEDEYFKLDKENKVLTKQLEKRNKVLLIVTTVLITLLVTFIVALITFNVPKAKDASPTEVQEVTEVQQSKVTPPQPVQNQRPVQKRTTYNQRKY